MSASRPHAAASVASTDAPRIDERAATRRRSAMECGERAGCARPIKPAGNAPELTPEPPAPVPAVFMHLERALGELRARAQRIEEQLETVGELQAEKLLLDKESTASATVIEACA
jgi:hypothetical protein